MRNFKKAQATPLDKPTTGLCVIWCISKLVLSDHFSFSFKSIDMSGRKRGRRPLKSTKEKEKDEHEEKDKRPPLKIHYRPELGFKQDLEDLLERFSSSGTVRYETFAEIWRDMDLSLFCAGRQTQRECREVFLRL